MTLSPVNCSKATPQRGGSLLDPSISVGPSVPAPPQEEYGSRKSQAHQGDAEYLTEVCTGDGQGTVIASR